MVTLPTMSPVEESLEEADSGFFSFSVGANCQVSMDHVTDRIPCPSPTYSVEPSSSPTLEQVLLLEEDLQEQEHWFDLYTQHTESDYDLAELVSSLNMKMGRLDVPPSSPTDPSYIITSSSKLFGPFPTSRNPPSRPRLPSKPQWEKQDDPNIASTRSNLDSSTSLSSVTPPINLPFIEDPQEPVLFDSSVPVSSGDPPPSPHTDPPLCTWTGRLPTRVLRNPTFSSKIFLGGVPWDVTESSLAQAFKQFGPIRIEWPGKDSSPSPPKGYVYVIFEYEQSIPLLLSQCSHDASNGGSWYFRLSSHRMRSKEVQIIPWVLADSNYIECPSQRLDPQRTVFVGALHGMLNAEGLATIFSDLFSGVVYAGIDTDKHRYPIGSGRVTFDNRSSYMKAVAAAFVEIKCQKFTKKVQVDPYLEDALCSLCLLKQGPYFCRDLHCFQYFCRFCWELHHTLLRHHKPLMRNTRSGGGPTTRPTISLTPPRNNYNSRDQDGD